MPRTRISIFLSLCIIICKVYGRHTHTHKSRNENSDLEDLILNENEKVGIYIITYVGDKYIKVEGDKLVGVQNVKEANMFDVDLPEDNKTGNEIKLMPWIKGEKYETTYNPIGDSINIGRPIGPEAQTKSNLTVIRNVITKNTSTPVFEIASAQKNVCFTLDSVTNDFHLQECSNGADDRQVFRFITYDEAIENEARKRGNIAFDIKDFLTNTPVPSASLIVASKSGVLYNQ